MQAISTVIKPKKNSSVKRLDKAIQPTLVGTIHVHPKGFAFVTPKDNKNYPTDIFIPKHLKGNAVDGDLVEVEFRPSRRLEKGPEGLVKAIIQRGREEIVGIVWVIDPKGNYVLHLPSLGKTKAAIVQANSQEQTYQIGDRLLVHILDWGKNNSSIKAEVKKKIGEISQPVTDIEVALEDFHLPHEFSKEVLKEADSFPATVTPDELAKRSDLTNLECITIDPDTARDFDDALSLTEGPSGKFQLGVHIADVSHYVTPGSMLDKEACRRSNSVYFPRCCVPMLPESLSNHLCSLVEGEIRLTVSILIDFDPSGQIERYEIKKGAIRSRKRFTYKEAKQVLEGKEKSPYLTLLQRMEKLCLLLKKRRLERGSVDLALPETVILVDTEGEPYDYSLVEYDITHQLVEEFMLTANAIVAESFGEKNNPALFRVHETPDQESIEEFYTLARSLGFSLSETPTIEEIQHLFTLAKKSVYAQQLSIGFIRSMKLASYSEENVGHYGLALKHYCHFTSPIRRYSDLVIHRLLFKEDSSLDLREISRQCSEKERIAAKAEMSVIALKKMRLLNHYYHDDPQRAYHATITKIKPFGIFFDVAPISLEGFISVSDLMDDYYDYHSKTQHLIGQNTGRIFKVGQSITALVQKVDLILVEATWSLPSKRKRKKKIQKRRKKRK